MKQRMKTFWITAIVIGGIAQAPLMGAAVGTAFTYHGQLKEDGLPTNGIFDLRFRLFNDTNGVVGGPICFDSVQVVNGLFTLALNFGTAFDGSARELEVGVRLNNVAGDCLSGAYTVLAPRQNITATPYAAYALNAPNGNSLDAADGNPVDALLVDAAGNVGIGTAGPENDLHIFHGSAGTITAHGNAPVVVENNANAYINILTPDANESGLLFGRPSSTVPNAAGGVIFNSFPNTDGLQFRTGGNQTRLVISSSGNVGVGTSAPTHLLHVNGSARVRSNASTNLLLTGTGDDAFIDFIKDTNTTPSARIGFDGFADQANHRGSIEFLTRGVGDAGILERMRITDTGNVGIGTTTPSRRLEVADAADAEIGLRSTDAGGRLWTLQSSAVSGGAVDGTFQIIDRTAGASRMTINTDGEVGIGTTTPDFGLDVERAAGAENVGRFRQTSAGIHSSITVDSLAGQDSILYLAENGIRKWGIRNDSTDSDAFEIRWHGDGANDAVLKIDEATNAGWLMTVDGHVEPSLNGEYAMGGPSSRWSAVWAVNGLIQTSDIRQKKDVVALDYGLKELLSLRPVRYKWKKESDPTVHLGLISQEVEPIVPEAVVKDAAKPDAPWALTYTTLIPVLIKAVQEQQEIINVHRERFNGKDAKIAELEARIAKLEALIQRQGITAK
jgi:hypothetical protein